MALGSLEAEVMACLASVHEASARDVRQALERRGVTVAYTTVATILGRLHEKKMVVRRRESCRGGARFVYRNVDFERKYLRNLLKGVVSLFGPAGVVHLNEELAKLRPGKDARLRRRLRL
jgi:predicted transcriptional regulator